MERPRGRASEEQALTVDSRPRRFLPAFAKQRVIERGGMGERVGVALEAVRRGDDGVRSGGERLLSLRCREVVAHQHVQSLDLGETGDGGELAAPLAFVVEGDVTVAEHGRVASTADEDLERRRG